MRSIEIYGTEKLFCGIQPRSIATQSRTGGNSPNLMINLRADPEDVKVVAEKVIHDVTSAIRVPMPLQRENISQFLKRQGIPEEYTKDDYIHSSITKAYPIKTLP